MYCKKMAGHTRNEDLLIYVLYESLTEAAAQWYTKLKKDQICTWRDLVRAFLGDTNTCMEKGPDDDYREYTVRWKNVALLVQPLLTNREENSMFVDTLPSPYYDLLIVNTFMEFEDLIYSVGNRKWNKEIKNYRHRGKHDGEKKNYSRCACSRNV